MRAAIIGAGFISDFHAQAYQSLADVRLCAVCDIRADVAAAQAAKFGCSSYTDASSMLETEKPELVSVCVPTFLHEEYVLLALSHGANVLCEKPLCLTMESAYRMQEAAQTHHAMLMTGQVLRWWPEYAEIRKQIQRFGTPQLMATQRLQHAAENTWLQNPQMGGGALFDLFIHDLDFLCSLMGYTPQVEAVDGRIGKGGAYSSLNVLLHWDNGCCARLESANQMPIGYPFTATLRADYRDACIEYRFQAPNNIEKNDKTQTELLLFDNGGTQALPLCADAQSAAFHQEIAAFVHGVRCGINPLPISETLSVMKLVHQIKALLDKKQKGL